MACTSGLNTRGEGRPRHAVGDREHLAQHPGELFGHLARGAEPAVRVRVGGAPQQPGERLLLAEQRHPVGQAVLSVPW